MAPTLPPISLPLLTLLQPSSPRAHPCTPTPGLLLLQFCLHRDILTPMAYIWRSLLPGSFTYTTPHSHYSLSFPAVVSAREPHSHLLSKFYFMYFYLPHWDADSQPWVPSSDNRPGVYWCRRCRMRSLGHRELTTALERMLHCKRLPEFTSLCQCPPP